MDKLKAVTLPIDEKTGQPKYLKELKALGKKKTADEECKEENKASNSKILYNIYRLGISVEQFMFLCVFTGYHKSQ